MSSPSSLLSSLKTSHTRPRPDDATCVEHNHESHLHEAIESLRSRYTPIIKPTKRKRPSSNRARQLDETPNTESYVSPSKKVKRVKRRSQQVSSKGSEVQAVSDRRPLSTSPMTQSHQDPAPDPKRLQLEQSYNPTPHSIARPFPALQAIRHNGHKFTLRECQLICALKIFLVSQNGEILTDDTISEIIKFARQSTESIDCGGLFDYLIDEVPCEWQPAVFRPLTQEKIQWQRSAWLAYWTWMTHMEKLVKRCVTDATLRTCMINASPTCIRLYIECPTSYLQMIFGQHQDRMPNTHVFGSDLLETVVGYIPQ